MRQRWYKFTSQQRKDALVKASELYAAGKNTAHILAVLNLDVMDKAKIEGVSRRPVQAVEPPPDHQLDETRYASVTSDELSTLLPPGKKRTRAQEIGAESDEYLAILRQLLPPKVRAQLLAAAASSANPLMAAKAIEAVDRLLMPGDGAPTVPIFELPPDTRLGFAPVVKEVKVGDEELVAYRERVSKILHRYWMEARTDEESARWQAALGEVVDD